MNVEMLRKTELSCCWVELSRGSTLVEEEGVGLVVGRGKEAVVKVGEQAF